MRTPRLKLEETAVYHCTSRILEDRRLLDEACRDHLRENIYKWADFCGVEILAFCILDDHCHILARVEPGKKPSSKELDRRYRLINAHLPAKLEQWDRESGKATVQAGVESRMGDISGFLKEFKQAVTPWINARLRRRGPLWFHRFGSILVEDRPEIVHTVAAYIDLNPVRAGLVKKPDLYPWCTSGHSKKSLLKHTASINEHLPDTSSPLHDRIPAFTLGKILGSPRFVLEKGKALEERYRPGKRNYAVPVPDLNPRLFTTYANPRLNRKSFKR